MARQPTVPIFGLCLWKCMIPVGVENDWQCFANTVHASCHAKSMEMPILAMPEHTHDLLPDRYCNTVPNIPWIRNNHGVFWCFKFHLQSNITLYCRVLNSP